MAKGKAPAKPKAKGKPKVVDIGKASMRDEMKWRAESMVRDRILNSPGAKAEVRRVCSELMALQKSVNVPEPKKG